MNMRKMDNFDKALDQILDVMRHKSDNSPLNCDHMLMACSCFDHVDTSTLDDYAVIDDQED